MKETSVMSNYGNYKIYRIHAIDYAKKVDSKFESIIKLHNILIN